MIIVLYYYWMTLKTSPDVLGHGDTLQRMFHPLVISAGMVG